MKEIKLYECSICHTTYRERLKCKDCEKSHRIPVKINNYRHLSLSQNKKGYPESITVEMDNGDKVVYKR